MKKSIYQDMSNQISSMMYEAKLRQGIKDSELGNRISLATSTMRNMRSQKTSCNIPFWKVFLIAQMAGYDIRFVKKGA